MSDLKDPEEGRLSPEEYAKRLREARKRTTQMKRQYRAEREKKRLKDAAKRWEKNHARKHADIRDTIVKANHARMPANRRVRRKYAKMLNAFKIPGGWATFNQSHKDRFGYQESIAPTNKTANVATAAPINKSIVDAINEGDK